MRSTNVLGKYDCPLQVGRDVPIEHRHTFELLLGLESAGWRCRVKHARGNVEPYRAGESKLFWVKNKSTSTNHYYLWALLAAGDDDEIFHFKPQDYYICLLKGGDVVFTFRIFRAFRAFLSVSPPSLPPGPSLHPILSL